MSGAHPADERLRASGTPQRGNARPQSAELSTASSSSGTPAPPQSESSSSSSWPLADRRERMRAFLDKPGRKDAVSVAKAFRKYGDDLNMRRPKIKAPVNGDIALLIDCVRIGLVSFSHDEYKLKIEIRYCAIGLWDKDDSEWVTFFPRGAIQASSLRYYSQFPIKVERMMELRKHSLSRIKGHSRDAHSTKSHQYDREPEKLLSGKIQHQDAKVGLLGKRRRNAEPDRLLMATTVLVCTMPQVADYVNFPFDRHLVQLTLQPYVVQGTSYVDGPPNPTVPTNMVKMLPFRKAQYDPDNVEQFPPNIDRMNRINRIFDGAGYAPESEKLLVEAMCVSHTPEYSVNRTTWINLEYGRVYINIPVERIPFSALSNQYFVLFLLVWSLAVTSYLENLNDRFTVDFTVVVAAVALKVTEVKWATTTPSSLNYYFILSFLLMGINIVCNIEVAHYKRYGFDDFTLWGLGVGWPGANLLLIILIYVLHPRPDRRCNNRCMRRNWCCCCFTSSWQDLWEDRNTNHITYTQRFQNCYFKGCCCCCYFDQDSLSNQSSGCCERCFPTCWDRSLVRGSCQKKCFYCCDGHNDGAMLDPTGRRSALQYFNQSDHYEAAMNRVTKQRKRQKRRYNKAHDVDNEEARPSSYSSDVNGII